ncbi:MAG: MFS transporter [Comamonadaceae bacterium]|nr:MFS transporter [Comamonadaceae bacterium]
MNPTHPAVAPPALGARRAAGLPGHARARSRSTPTCRRSPASRASLGATPVQMQQTLSAYLFGFALMNLFHGALADSFGRRPVILRRRGAVHAGLGRLRAGADRSAQLVFFRALQGMAAGAGIVVSRAVIRDMFPPADAQRVMSQVTIFFGVAPAVAPMVGGLLFVHADWHVDLLVPGRRRRRAVAGQLALLPETLHAGARQPFNARNLMRGYWQLVAQPALHAAGAGQRRAVQRHVPVRAVGAGVPRRASCGWRRRSSSGSSCITHRRHHGRRLASAAGWPGGIEPRRQIRHGFAIMVAVSLRQRRR